MDKLKPCPCCGSERVDTLKGNWMESEKPFWKVWCKSCQLRTWCEPTRKGAISVWNTRATDTDPALAAAEAELKEWRDMGVRAVTGGRGSGLELPMANEIWPNEWRQDVAMVAHLIHSHETRIAELESYNFGLATESHQQQERIVALEKVLERIKARSDAYVDADAPMNPDSSVQVISDICAAALLKEKE